MQWVSLQDHLKEIYVYWEDLVTLKYFHCMQVNIFKTQFCDLRQIYLESIVNKLQNVLDLILVGFLNKNRCGFTKLFFRALNGVLVGSLDQGDNYASWVKTYLPTVDELNEHLHNSDIDVRDHDLARTALNEWPVEHVRKHFRWCG